MEKWNLDEYYVNNKDWFNDLETLKSFIPKLASYQGKLNNYDDFSSFYKLDDESTKLFYRLYGFTSLSSDLNLKDEVNVELAASLASLPFIGITVGRAINGFLTYKFNDTTLIRIGSIIILLGIIVMFLPFGMISSCISLVLIGFGCAPIYPCIMHL